MKSIILVLVSLIMSFAFTSCASSSAANASSDEVVIKTETIQCGMCKDRIETSLSEQKGIKSVTVDVDKKETTVVFNPKKINPDAIKKAIAAVGYDADDVEAESGAYNDLPTCCQKGGH
ncbi:heavy-metal-associated domain-containing protein [Bernardetia sp. ABR2-2B]|uniref:heavy-metal-associated domain-containing protein n=1 Tax=Bernardetia sp. ABR2-2B TaxID=3127472 RepID=UPI0030CC6D97